MNYSKIIKKLRVSMLLTQQEFANVLGVSFESVNRWENGKNDPTMKVRRKIKQLLKENNIAEDEEVERNE